MNKRFVRALQITLAIMDFFFINAMFFMCEFIFRTHNWIKPEEFNYMYVGFLISAAWIIVVLSMSVYNEPYILSFEEFTKRTIQGYIVFLLLVLMSLFLFGALKMDRAFLVTVLSLVFAIFIVNRFVYLAFQQYFKNKEWLVNKVIILGHDELAMKLAGYLAQDGINKKVVGFVTNEMHFAENGIDREWGHHAPGTMNGTAVLRGRKIITRKINGNVVEQPILGRIEDTLEICQQNDISEIYSTLAPEQNPDMYQIIQQADQRLIRFKLVPDVKYFINGRVYLDYLNDIPIIHLRNEPLEDLDNRIKKRIFDIIVSFIVITCILSWLVPIIGLLIWLESKGPIFFAQRRSGKDNKPFYCLKFRSMHVNDKANELQATKNDKRITKIGKFLRRTSLDEFPQFINVLKGQMSIVGPRPHMLKHTDEYSQQIDTFMIRHFVKPGITGWAQVNGYRGETYNIMQMQKRVEYDLWYLENWSLLVDIKIMFMTVFNTLKGEKNAY